MHFGAKLCRQGLQALHPIVGLVSPRHQKDQSRIVDANPLELAETSGVRCLLREPFIASWATDAKGNMCRPTPAYTDLPFAYSNIIQILADNRIVERPDIFVLELLDSTLIGQRAFLLRSGLEVITDSTRSWHTAAIFRDAKRAKFEKTRLGVNSDGKTFYRVWSRAPVIKFNRPVTVLTTMEYDNYGSFLLRVIPKIIAVRQLKLESSRLLVPGARPWQLPILRAFGLPMDNVIVHNKRRDYKSSVFFVPSLRTPDFFLDDSTWNMFQEMSRKATTQNGIKLGEKIYVSRLGQGKKHPTHRVFCNEAEVIKQLESRGFCIVEPENLEFMDQIRIFANARIVVGPGGAGMFNTVFCRPGTTIVDLESQDDWVVLHASIFGSCRHNYSMIIGGADQTDPSVQRRWRTDVGVLMKKLTPSSD